MNTDLEEMLDVVEMMLCKDDYDAIRDYGLFLQVVASGIVGIISWRRPLTLVVCKLFL